MSDEDDSNLRPRDKPDRVRNRIPRQNVSCRNGMRSKACFIGIKELSSFKAAPASILSAHDIATVALAESYIVS